MPDAPVGQAIVLCERIEKNPRTGSLSLIDLYGRILREKFPVEEKIVVYVAIMGTVGQSKIDLFMSRHGSTGLPRLVNTVTSSFESTEDVREYEIASTIRFDRPGHFILEVRADEVPVLWKQFWMEQKPV
jgi:hypothetical protein